MPRDLPSNDGKHEMATHKLLQVRVVPREQTDELLASTIRSILAGESATVFNPLSGLHLPEMDRGSGDLICSRPLQRRYDDRHVLRRQEDLFRTQEPRAKRLHHAQVNHGVRCPERAWQPARRRDVVSMRQDADAHYQVALGVGFYSDDALGNRSSKSGKFGLHPIGAHGETIEPKAAARIGDHLALLGSRNNGDRCPWDHASTDISNGSRNGTDAELHGARREDAQQGQDDCTPRRCHPLQGLEPRSSNALNSPVSSNEPTPTRPDTSVRSVAWMMGVLSSPKNTRMLPVVTLRSRRRRCHA
jgi:hypothetical protein